MSDDLTVMGIAATAAAAMGRGSGPCEKTGNAPSIAKLGVKMAQPAFQAKDLIEQHSIAVISGNLQFYTDMSNRVMQVFGELIPAVEKYSIDECFLDLTGIPQELTAFCQDLKRTVRQWTGLPISIGIAETKTLAKIANRLAKTSAKRTVFSISPVSAGATGRWRQLKSAMSGASAGSTPKNSTATVL